MKRVVWDLAWFLTQDETLKEPGQLRYRLLECGQKYLAYVQKVCEELDKYNVPLAVVHRDLDTLNIAKSTEDGYRFLEFEFTCSSVPFIDALNPGGLQRVNDEKFDGLDFYLVMWTAYELLRRLRKYLTVAGEFRDALIAVRSYQLFRNEEQSGIEEA